MPHADFLSMTQPLQKKMIERVEKCGFVNQEVVYDWLGSLSVPNPVTFDVAHKVISGHGGRIELSNFQNVPQLETDSHIMLCMSELAQWGLHAPLGGYAYSDNNQRITAIKAYLYGKVLYDLTLGTEFGDWLRRFGEPDKIIWTQSGFTITVMLTYEEEEKIEAIMLGDTSIQPPEEEHFDGDDLDA